MPSDKEIQASYCRGFSKLSIWYARKRILDGQSDFENAFNERVNIFRNTSLFKDGKHPVDGVIIPEWVAILGKVEQIFDEHINDADTTDLENKSLAVFWPVLQGKASTFKRWKPSLEQRPYEAWSFDYRKEYLNIHIGNTYAPDSPLSEKRIQFAAALIRMLEDSQRDRPEVVLVACGSWLNSVPTFLDLFTAGWKASGKAGRNVRYTLGHWGQFTDRRGDFHARNGDAFRRTGDFPYPSLSCNDRIDSVLDHLRSAFPEALEHNRATHNR
jgi:hypothetical protein